MAPAIRYVRRYSNHEKYLVNFFGERFIVTVTDNSSAINRWIRDVVYHIRNRFSSRPLVVGVGVQWIPDTKKSKSPPYNYADSPPTSYYTDSPPASYYTDSPPASYYSDSAQNLYYSDSPSPPASYYSDSPPPHASNDSSDNPAETLQLCVGKKCLIIQLRYCDHIPNILRTFLTDPRTKFVGVWNHRDARKLDRCMHQLEIGKLLDIRLHVKDLEGWSVRPSSSFEKIVEECLGYEGVRVGEEIGRSNWSNYNLNDDQILQASVDVFVCHKLAIRDRLWRL